MVSYPTRNHFNQDVLKDNTRRVAALNMQRFSSEQEKQEAGTRSREDGRDEMTNSSH